MTNYSTSSCIQEHASISWLVNSANLSSLLMWANIKCTVKMVNHLSQKCNFVIYFVIVYMCTFYCYVIHCCLLLVVSYDRQVFMSFLWNKRRSTSMCFSLFFFISCALFLWDSAFCAHLKILIVFYMYKKSTKNTRNSLEAKNSPQMPIVYKRQNL